VLVSGFNVYPAEVERVLDAHPAVAESAVIGVPDPRTGAAVRAVVVLRPGRTVTVEELTAHAAASLARYKVPTSVHFLPALPHSLTGKVSRVRLRELGLTTAAGASQRGTSEERTGARGQAREQGLTTASSAEGDGGAR
jgi:long-chain acyl-CoA synthetase